MTLEEMIDQSNDKISSLMDVREELAGGADMYFETPRNNGTIAGNEALVKGFDVLIQEQSKKHRELVEAVKKVNSLVVELNIY